jgi:hypothetical protein
VLSKKSLIAVQCRDDIMNLAHGEIRSTGGGTMSGIGIFGDGAIATESVTRGEADIDDPIVVERPRPLVDARCEIERRSGDCPTGKSSD